jgi:hypothetical protein
MTAEDELLELRAEHRAQQEQIRVQQEQLAQRDELIAQLQQRIQAQELAPEEREEARRAGGTSRLDPALSVLP